MNKSVHLAPTRRTILAAGILSVAMIFAAPTTEAASVTWGAATNITGDSDVSTSGTLVGAINIGAPGVANTTANGVLVTGLALTGNNVTSGDFNLVTAGGFGASNGLGSGSPPFSALSPQYQTLLASAATSFTAGITLTMSGLVVGERYQFQWWSNASGGTASVLTSATAGNSVTLATSPSGGQGEVGQFALGTFIADNAAQVVTFDGPVQDILNGFQLRQLGPVDATWLGNVSSDWNSGTNWIGDVAPEIPGETATFNTSTNTSPTLSANVTIDSITFNPGASAFTIQTNGHVLTLLGVGIVNNSGSVQTINNSTVISDGVVFIGQTIFSNGATADAMVITNSGAGSSTHFLDNSTAANATIINSGPNSYTLFGAPVPSGTPPPLPSAGTAANATITNSGDNSFTVFNQGGSGGNAALINANPTAFITIAELEGAGTTVGSIAGNGAIFLGSKNLTVGGSQQSTLFSGVISDGEAPLLPDSLRTGAGPFAGGSLTKVGAGTLTLTGVNSYTGGTNLNGGILAVNSDLNLGAGPLSFNGGTLEALGAGGGITSLKAINLAAGGGTFLADAGTASTLSGAITGVGVWTKSGPGTLTLTGVNSYSGGTNLNGGILAAASDFNLGTGPLSFNGGTLEALGAGGGITSVKAVNLGAGGGTFLADAGTASTLGGAITGVGVWTKSGPGTLTLTGVNAYSGGTNLNGGILAVNTDVNLGTGALSFNGGTLQALVAGGGIDWSKAVNLAVGGGTFLADAGTASTLSGPMTGVGAWTKAGPGTLILTGANTYSGGTTVSAGTLQLGNGGTTGSITGNVANNGILAFNRSDAVTFGGVISGTGGVQQNGTGTTLLIGNNTYTGGTIINAGTLQLGNGGTGGSITGNVLNNGILAFNRSDFVTFDGLISGTGALAKLGSGTLTLPNSNIYNGGTTISGGTILTQNASALGTGPVAFGNGTALQVQNLLNVNGNWTVFPGVATVSGDTVQTFGDFNLGGGGTLIANASFDVPGAAQINNSGLVVNNQFTVGGGIDLTGSSEAIVNGLLTSPIVNVNNVSSLIVNIAGTVAANVNVGPSALLALFGAINGNVTNAGIFQGTGVANGNVINSGLVSPGTSVGKLSINGNYAQNASGTLRIEVAGSSPGQFDVLAVSGQASLAGTVQLVRVGSFNLTVGDQITFLTANGGVIGTFGNVENDFLVSDSIVVFDVVYLPNGVVLEGTQGSFAEFAGAFCGTPNSVAVGQALDSAVGDPRASELIGFLNNQTLIDLCDDLDLISPEQLTSIFVIGVSLANVQTANLERRMDDIHRGSTGFSSSGFAINGSGPSFSEGFAGVSGPEGKSGPPVFAPIPQNRWGVFVTGIGEFTDVDSTFNASGYDLATGGFTMGIDYRIGSHFAIGLTGGYAYTDADLVNNSSITVNGGKLGLYATAFGSGFYLDTAVIGGLNGYDTRRTALEGTASGDTLGGDLNVLVAAGYDWKKGGLSIGPTASFQYTLVGIGDFTESGSLAPLAFPDQHAESFRTAFGMKASYNWKIGPIHLIPEVRTAWQHEFGDTDYSLISSFASGAGNSFTVNGPEIGRDSMLLGAGFAIHWNDRISTYAYYDGELFRTNYISNNVSAGFRVTF